MPTFLIINISIKNVFLVNFRISFLTFQEDSVILISLENSGMFIPTFFLTPWNCVPDNTPRYILQPTSKFRYEHQTYSENGFAETIKNFAKEFLRMRPSS